MPNARDIAKNIDRAVLGGSAGDGRFVRITMHGWGAPAWGLYDDRIADFLAIWSSDMEVLRSEFGVIPSSAGLTEDEVNSMLDANDPRAQTPPEAWAALAVFRLIGE